MTKQFEFVRILLLQSVVAFSLFSGDLTIRPEDDKLRDITDNLVFNKRMADSIKLKDSLNIPKKYGFYSYSYNHNFDPTYVVGVDYKVNSWLIIGGKSKYIPIRKSYCPSTWTIGNQIKPRTIGYNGL